MLAKWPMSLGDSPFVQQFGFSNQFFCAFVENKRRNRKSKQTIMCRGDTVAQLDSNNEVQACLCRFLFTVLWLQLSQHTHERSKTIGTSFPSQSWVSLVFTLNHRRQNPSHHHCQYSETDKNVYKSNINKYTIFKYYVCWKQFFFFFAWNFEGVYDLQHKLPRVQRCSCAMRIMRMKSLGSSKRTVTIIWMFIYLNAGVV